MGGGVPREQAPAVDIPTATPDAVIFMRPDGSTYGENEAKDVAVVPGQKVYVAVDEEGNEITAAGPTLANQYSHPAWKQTWTQSPKQIQLFDLDVPEQLAQYNQLLTQMEPEGAPAIALQGVREHACPVTGHLKVYVYYRRITYKKILKVDL